MRILAASEMAIIHGGTATTDYSSPSYRIAGAITEMLIPILNVIPFIGIKISDWLQAPRFNETVKPTNGQYYLGRVLEQTIGSWLK